MSLLDYLLGIKRHVVIEKTVYEYEVICVVVDGLSESPSTGKLIVTDKLRIYPNGSDIAACMRSWSLELNAVTKSTINLDLVMGLKKFDVTVDGMSGQCYLEKIVTADSSVSYFVGTGGLTGYDPSKMSPVKTTVSRKLKAV